MIDSIIQYPIFYPCINSLAFTTLDTNACTLLGFPDEGAKDYCYPIIDINGVYYFTINPEVLSLFTAAQLAQCVEYSAIIFPPK